MSDIDKMISELEQEFLKAANAAPIREAGWFVADQAAVMFGGYSASGTLKKLSDAVKAGKLECRSVYDPKIGRIRKVWRPVSNDSS